MYYVMRDAEGRISQVHAEARPGMQVVADDDPEVLQYIHERWRENELNQLDREFVRVIEDTIELLMAKNLILFTDLPPMVQQKFLRRREVRQQTHFSDVYQAGDDIIPL